MEKSPTRVDRRGTSFLVPVGIGLVFMVLAIGWIAQSGHKDSSTATEVLSRPHPAPSSK